MLTKPKFVTLRIPPAIDMEVRRIADRESETQSTILRRLLRHGLDAERGRDHAEAAQ